VINTREATATCVAFANYSTTPVGSFPLRDKWNKASINIVMSEAPRAYECWVVFGRSFQGKEGR
jgi:hypothetical protein